MNGSNALYQLAHPSSEPGYVEFSSDAVQAIGEAAATVHALDSTKAIDNGKSAQVSNRSAKIAAAAKRILKQKGLR